MSIGDRLKEERDRLMMSQSLLSSKAGVGRMTQGNYESGKRLPDAEYLKNVAIAGVDINYVVTGHRIGAPDFQKMTTTFVLQYIEKKTGFAVDVLMFVIEVLTEAATSAWSSDESKHDNADFDFDMTRWVNSTALQELIQAVFENALLLRDIFGTVNFVLLSYPAQLLGEKRLDLILMLYRAFKKTGEIDTDVVERGVRLITEQSKNDKVFDNNTIAPLN